MGEDRIERNHQTRARDGVKFSRARNKGMIMRMQAKAQNIRIKKSVTAITSNIKVECTRKKRKLFTKTFLNINLL